MAVGLSQPAPAAGSPGDLEEEFGRGGLLKPEVADEQGLTDLAVGAGGAVRAVGITGKTSCGHITCDSVYDQLVVAATAEGALEDGFGDGGLFDTDHYLEVPYTSSSIAALADDAVVVAAGSRLERFEPPGNSTKLLPPSGGSVDDLLALADGRLYVSGWIETSPGSDLLVERRLADGQPDPSFASDGSVSIGAGYWDGLSDLVLGPDGALWAVGLSTQTSVSDAKLIVARILADGSPDPTFAGDGLETYELTSPPEPVSMAAGIADGENLIVIARVSSGTLALRIRADGTFDPSFGSDGIVHVDRQVPGYTVDAAGLGGGRIALVRERGLSIMDTDGTVDQSFGGDGVASPYGLRAAGAVAAGDDHVLLYGETAADLLVAKFELEDDGMADADADGISDGADRCPETYGPEKGAGCPALRRDVELDYWRGDGGYFTALVTPPCPGATKVRLTRRVSGEVRRRWSATATANIPEAIFDVQRRQGRYRAVARRVVAPPVGRCLAAWSNTLRVK